MPGTTQALEPCAANPPGAGLVTHRRAIQVSWIEIVASKVSQRPHTAKQDKDSWAFAVHKQLGEMMALDYQLISIVEDVGFKRFVNTLEPKYNLPNQKYVTETILYKISIVQHLSHKTVHFLIKHQTFYRVSSMCTISY